MGYPMTWRRLINRNALSDGDYGEPPRGWRQYAGFTAFDVLRESATKPGAEWDGEKVDPVGYLIGHAKTVQGHAEEAADRTNGRLATLAGDLRRLERDTLDEGHVCTEIARRTGLSPDQVAAVLKEWLAV